MPGPLIDNGALTDYTPRTREVASEHVGEIAAARSTAAPVNKDQGVGVQDLLVANDLRVGFVIQNEPEDMNGDLFVKFGTAASTSSYTRRLLPGETWDRPLCPYKGVITAVWDLAGAGKARVTEEVAG